MKNKAQILETERLSLKKLNLDDSAFIIELVNTPGWIKYIGDRNIKTIEQANNYLTNGPILSYEVNGFGLWLVELRADKTSIGMCGIIKRETLSNPDIGFALLPAYYGKGYAHEIAAAVMSYATNQLNLKEICAITLPNNKSSIKLLEKIGLKFIKNFSFPDSKEKLMLFNN